MNGKKKTLPGNVQKQWKFKPFALDALGRKKTPLTNYWKWPKTLRKMKVSLHGSKYVNLGVQWKPDEFTLVTIENHW